MYLKNWLAITGCYRVNKSNQLKVEWTHSIKTYYEKRFILGAKFYLACIIFTIWNDLPLTLTVTAPSEVPSMFVATQMYLPESSSKIFWMIKFLLVSFNETFLFISSFFSHLHKIRASGFAVTLQYNLTVCCSFTVRILGETRTFGGLNDKPGVPGGPCKPGVPGFPIGPGNPFDPLGPAFPVTPCLPVVPGCPGGPGGPIEFHRR